MAEHNVNTVKAQIQSLINKANETTGNTDTTLTDGVNALVSGYGQGGSGGSLEGLENGYDVMFYDENNEGLAFYSIRQGDGINAPIYNAKKWLDSDGNVVTFPYIPTSDIMLYADNSGLVSILYELYEVSPVDYPYLFISYNSYYKQPKLYFCDSYDVTGNAIRVIKKSKPVKWTFTTQFTSDPTIEEIVGKFQTEKPTLNEDPNVYVYPQSSGSLTDYTVYTNVTDTITITSNLVVIE